MATARLIPSTLYNAAGTTYLTVTNEDNMFTNTDSTTYGTVNNVNSSTSSRYVYLRGFNFSDIPSDATVNSFTIKLKASESNLSTSTNYRPRICNGTTTLTGSSSTIGTSASVITFTSVSPTWDTIAGYGSNFGIRINVRRSQSGTAGSCNIYGAEILVNYTLPDPRTITSTLSGSGTIDPSGAITAYDGDEYEITITPTNISNAVTVTNNGTDVTEDLVEHYSGGTPTSYSTASGSNVTTGFARSGSQFYRGSSSTTGDDWLRYAIGKTAESPYSTSNTSNTYCKDGTNDATTQGWMNYPFDFSGLPNDAEVTAVEVKCYGAAESTTETARHADISLWCGSTQKGTTQSFTSTSNSTITINDPGEWDREELQDAWVRFGVGYYGGRILGITWKVNYTYGGTLHHYTYTYTVNGNATIAVTIAGSSTPPTITVGTPSRSIISDESGYDQCVCTFKSDLALQQWEARATKSGTTPARGVGLLVESGGSLAANTNATVTVDDEELTQGDGEYTITVYGLSTGGIWSG